MSSAASDVYKRQAFCDVCCHILCDVLLRRLGGNVGRHCFLWTNPKGMDVILIYIEIGNEDRDKQSEVGSCGIILI